MRLSSFKNKEIQEGTFRAKKIRKTLFLKRFLYFGKWDFLASSLKNFLYFKGEL